MNDLLLAWVAFPVLMGALSLCCGLAVQAAVGKRMRAVLLLPTGFAVIVVVAQLATMYSRTAQFAAPAVVAVALAGLALSLPWPTIGRRDSWSAVGALGAFAAFAAPVVLSGSATFTGWIRLDDGATWLAITDRVMEHGRSLAGLPPSTYQVTLEAYLGTGYPVGAFVPLGVGGKLLGQDIAFLVAPYLAFVAAMVALAVYALTSRILRHRSLQALAACVAAQASTFYGYALWGGTKEIVAGALIALVAALVPMLLEPDATPRAAIPLGVATAATLGALTIGGVVWLAPILVAALWLTIRAHGKRFAGAATAWFMGISLFFAIPTLAITRSFANATSSSSVLTSGKELGNLFHPLSFAQIFGIWPTGDFRVDPRDIVPTYLLLAVAGTAAVVAVLTAVRRSRPELVMFVASALAGSIVLTALGSPWVGGKALATASPALVAAAVVGAAVLFEGGARVAGVVALVAVAGGVIWSNVLQYHDTDLAPRAELAELSTIGTEFAGQGPTLMTEYSPYGARHYLRDLDPESASEFRWRTVPLLNGQGLDKGQSADIDEFQTDGVLVYRTLVVRRSATASRPPSVYRLAWRGHYYEVWQRPGGGATPIVEHMPLGSARDPAAVPRCEEVSRLAARAGSGGYLVAVARSGTRTINLNAATRPSGWLAYSGLPGTVTPTGAGTLGSLTTVSAPGRYGFWLGGSFRDRIDLLVDGNRIYSGGARQTWPGVYTPVGAATLTKGRHRIEIRYHGQGIRPGGGGEQLPMGPLVFGRDTAESQMMAVPVADALSLCGKRLDWIEVVSS